MRVVTFEHQQRRSIGFVRDDRVIDLQRVGAAMPSTMLDLIRGGSGLLADIARADMATADAYPLADVRLLAPIPNPSKYLAIGMNYQEHAQEALRKGIPVPTSQLWFNKQVSCVTGPYDSVHMPSVSRELDYEAELAVIIGKRCRHVSRDQAASVIFGYTIANDVSVRDWQLRSPTFTLGKSFDTHGPLGPWIVTANEIPDPHRLDMRMLVNGEVRQSTSTGDMIYDIYDQIEYLSTVMTLEPGDVIATGTPSGVGVAMNPPRFLEIDDVMRVEIDGIGHIENVVIAEPR
ncbi:fumarylacetoacetate hydrolase family protein [Paraburkholderia sp.]|uniref:fumarylacetoacetate hydrolase family protein n=1 Tax=Paraburkholderia sp. TaxID=1926495 RepID=UPI0039E47171